MQNVRKAYITLVELIVVLTILAILAALLIPALTGYIDNAKNSQIIAQTRMLHSAIQSTISEHYADDSWQNYDTDGGISSADMNKYIIAAKNGTDSQQALYADIIRLAEIPELSQKGQFGAYVTEDGKLAVLIYKNGKGKIGIYFGDTAEYISYDESDFSGFDGYFTAIKDKVFYTKYYEDNDKTYANPYIKKENILFLLGYKN